MTQLLTGIQQVGIGVSNAPEAFAWYRHVFGVDVQVFDDVAEAKLMTRYTGAEVHKRRAILALNLNGGGGFEIWQYVSRTPKPANFAFGLGDLGINAIKIKSRDVAKAHAQLQQKDVENISALQKAPDGRLSFWVFDPYGNRFQVTEGDSWFANEGNIGGVTGVCIGVSDIEKQFKLYQEVLGFETIVYDKSGVFEDLDNISCRRVLLRKPQKNEGAFSKLTGAVEVELIQLNTTKPVKIFENRFWGDLGFIHVCFDVNDMDKLKAKCESAGYDFTVDSANAFDMGDAAGRFAYIEDADGTWIEFVQTFKVPVVKKWGWFINLSKRKTTKPLPDWMLKALRFNRIKS